MQLTSALKDLLRRDGQQWALVDALTDTARLRARIAELEKVREEIESASNAKSELLAMIAHELSPPMTGLIRMVDLLMNTDLTGELGEYLETIRSSARSLLRLLNDLLEYLKLEGGKLESNPAQFPLRMTLHTIVNPLVYLASQKGLTLRHSL